MALTKLIKSTKKWLTVRAMTISGYSMTSSIMASGADFEETHLLLLFEETASPSSRDENEKLYSN